MPIDITENPTQYPTQKSFSTGEPLNQTLFGERAQESADRVGYVRRLQEYCLVDYSGSNTEGNTVGTTAENSAQFTVGGNAADFNITGSAGAQFVNFPSNGTWLLDFSLELASNDISNPCTIVLHLLGEGGGSFSNPMGIFVKVRNSTSSGQLVPHNQKIMVSVTDYTAQRFKLIVHSDSTGTPTVTISGKCLITRLESPNA